MQTLVSSANVSFHFLKGESDFMNLVLDNISSCILLLNNKMELQAFNDVMKTIFSNKANEDKMYMRCGEAIGCAYQIEENKDCGKTTHCCSCELRMAALNTYSENLTIYKEHIVKPFYSNLNKKVDKHLQFSTRAFSFKKEKYVLLIVDDISKYYKEAC